MYYLEVRCREGLSLKHTAPWREKKSKRYREISFGNCIVKLKKKN
jgi:hypothetical protein